MFIPFIFSLPIVLILTTIGNHISDKDEFSQKFILDIKHKLNDATTLAELIEIRNEFESEEINKETNQFRLAYPNTLSNIHTELLNKIEILKKQKL
jgi:hypothetical protein